MIHVASYTSVSDVMRNVITLSLHHTKEDAIELMQECGIGSIVLLDGEAPVGIVTRADLLRGEKVARVPRDLLHCQCCGVDVHLRITASGVALCISCRASPAAAFAS
jgi:CBS-domain-containing membrane protein